MARRSAALLLASFSALALWNCSASEGSNADGPYDSGDAGDLDGDGSSIIDIGPHGGAGGASGSGLSALCGAGECVPDDAEGCQGGASGLGGYGGLGDLGPQGSGCRLDFSCNGDSCTAGRACGSVGSGDRGAPCFASSDCAAGLACVGETATGSCQPFCCRGTEASCEADEFCSARKLAGQVGAIAPVCLPTENCPLSDPFPCPEGRSCACTGELACVVVRSDGQTACATPGEGKEGEACSGDEPGECAHGYVCSHAAGCLKLCSPLEDESGCKADQACQTPADFPVDLGVCVSAGGGAEVAK